MENVSKLRKGEENFSLGSTVNWEFFLWRKIPSLLREVEFQQVNHTS